MKPTTRNCLIFLLLLAACGCGKEAPPAADAKAVKVPNVAVQTIEVRDVTERAVLPGTVAPDQDVLLSAETGGTVERLAVREGQWVKAGDVLVEIDRQTSRLSLDRAEAALRQATLARQEADLDIRRWSTGVESAQSAVEQARLAGVQAGRAVGRASAALENQRRHFDRLSTLFKEKLVAQAAWDDARTALTLAEADEAAARTSVEAAAEAVRSAEGNLSTARIQLEGAELRVGTADAQIASADAARHQARLAWEKGLVTAPIDSWVEELFFDEREFVKAEAALARLIRTNPVRVKVNLAESDIPLLARGLAAGVTVTALPGRQFSGTITLIDLSADSRTNTYSAEITVPNPTAELKPGMVAQATVVRRRVTGAVAVPAFAVVPKEEGDVAFVLDGTRVVRRKVSTGILENGWVEITSGLAAGDRLVVKGQRDLLDGQEVRVQP